MDEQTDEWMNRLMVVRHLDFRRVDKIFFFNLFCLKINWTKVSLLLWSAVERLILSAAESRSPSACYRPLSSSPPLMFCTLALGVQAGKPIQSELM